MHEKQYCKLASLFLEAWFQSKYRVSNTWIPLADLGIFCHIDLKSYRLEFVKSKSESIGLEFYSGTNQIRLEQRNTLGRKKKKKKKKKKRRRRGRRTEDQIRQEKEELDLEGRRRKKFVHGMWRMRIQILNTRFPRGFFSTSDFHHM